MNSYTFEFDPALAPEDAEDIFFTADYEDTDGFREPSSVTNLPHALSSPLLTTHLDLLESARIRKPLPTLASSAAMGQSLLFWAQMEVEFGTDMRPMARRVSSRELVKVQRAILGSVTSIPLAPPHEKVVEGLANRLADYLKVPVETMGTFLVAGKVRCHLAAAKRARHAYDRLRREESSIPSEAVRFQAGDITIAICRRGSMYHVGGRWYFGSLQMFLCVLLAVETQARAEHAICHLPAREDPLHYSIVGKIAEWMRSVVERYGEQGYAIAKAPEAMAKTLTSRLAGGNELVADGFIQMIVKYTEKEEALLGGGSFTAELAAILVDAADTPDTCLELASLIHCAGYPIMDPSTSAAKSRRLGAERGRGSVVEAVLAIRLTSHLVAKNYIKIHGRWPPITFGDKTTQLWQLVQDGVIAIDDRSYPLSDWDSAEIEKIAEFDPHPDYLELIADKACFAGLDERQAHYEGRLSDRTLRRLVSRVLEGSISTEAEIEAFTRDALPEYMLGADLSPKEREFKAEARMFIILHPVIRRCLSIAQENIKSAIFPYIPYTSMAMSEQELDSTLLSATSSVKRPWFLELDLSSWNIRFHRGLCEIIGHKLGKMVGKTGIFGQSHRWFERMELMVSVPGLRVPQLEGGDPEQRRTWCTPGDSTDQLWYGDDSGKEGIEQRFWTVLTEVMVYAALFDEPYSFKLIGQGDNQTVVIDFAGVSDDDFPEESRRITDKIELMMERFGHEAKPEEYCSSTAILTYSKKYYDKGRPLASELKWFQMIQPSIAEIDNTFEDAYGSIFSASAGAARAARYPLSAWTFGLIIASDFLMDAASNRLWLPADHQLPFKGLIEHFKDDALRCLLTVPTVIGGLPCVPWTTFQVSGNPDPLSEALASLMPFEGMTWVDKVFRGLCDPGSYVDEPQMKMLVSNPYGIPLRRKAVARGVVDRATMEALVSVGNREISQLAQMSIAHSDALAVALTSVTPQYPAISADLYSYSAVGRADRVVGKFKASGTVTGLVRNGTLIRSFNSAAKARVIDGVLFMTSILSTTYRGSFTSRLSHVRSRHLREFWKCPGGICGLDTAQPWDYDILDTPGEGVVATRLPDYSRHRVGPLKPYSGSRTKERRSHTASEIARDPGIGDLERIVASATAGVITNEVRLIYERIVESRCSVPLATLIDLMPNTVGGAPAHRYDSLGSSPIRPVGNRAVACWVALNTDNIPGVSASQEDWPFAIQSFMSAAVAIHAMRERDPESPRYLRIALTTRGSAKIPDPPRSAPGIVPPVLPPPIGNHLAFIPEVRVMAPPRRLGGSTIRPTSVTDSVRLLAGVMFAKMVGERSSAATHVGGSGNAEDAAVHAAMGSEATFQAGAIAAFAAAFWTASVEGGRHEARVPFRLSLDHSSSVVASMLAPAYSGGWGDCSFVWGSGFWIRSTGKNGEAAAVDQLRRVLSYFAMDMAGDTSLNIISCILLPDIWPNAPPFFPLRWKAAALFWRCMTMTGTPAMGPYRRFVRSVQKELNVANVTGQLVDSATLPTLASVVEDCRDILETDLDQFDLVVSALRPLETYDGDIVSASRRLRSVLRADPPPARAGSKPIALPGPPFVRDTPGVYSDTDSQVLIPWELPVAPGRTEAEIIRDRMGRSAGRRSVVAQMWSPHISNVPGPVLVVGTGQGGIQHYLASIGVESVGLDLATVIPPELAASASRDVPECPGERLARLSDLMFTGSGDWFECGTKAVHEMLYSTVIIDIELSRERVGLRVLRPLLDSRFRGLVYWRCFLRKSEAQLILRILGSSVGIRGAAWTPLSSRPISDECSIPGLIQFHMLDGARLNDTPRVMQDIMFSATMVTGIDAQSKKSAIRAATGALTGGYVAGSSLEAFHARILSCLDGYKDGKKGGVTGALGLAPGRALALLKLMIDGAERGDPPEVVCMTPVTPFTDGTLHIWDDPTVRYLRRKVLPRLYAALAM